MGRDNRAIEAGMSAIAGWAEQIESPHGMFMFTRRPGVLWKPRLHPGNLQSIDHDNGRACNDSRRPERYHSEGLVQPMDRIKKYWPE